MNLIVTRRPNRLVWFDSCLFGIGGFRLHSGRVNTPTAELTIIKLFINSVISTPGACFLTVDVKDFYLNTPMNRFKYMQIPDKDTPKIIMQQYNLQPKIDENQILVEIHKGMYGLPQAGLLANQWLVRHLTQYGYAPTPHTPGIFRHRTCPVTFALIIVDDFGSNMLVNTMPTISSTQSKISIQPQSNGKDNCTWASHLTVGLQTPSRQCLNARLH
jgi:hypothetical protein